MRKVRTPDGAGPARRSSPWSTEARVAVGCLGDSTPTRRPARSSASSAPAPQASRGKHAARRGEAQGRGPRRSASPASPRWSPPGRFGRRCRGRAGRGCAGGRTGLRRASHGATSSESGMVSKWSASGDAIPVPARSMVLWSRRATPQGRRVRCAHRRVRHGRRPGPVGSRAPSSDLDPLRRPLRLGGDPAVRGPTMTIPPLDPSAQSDGNLDESSTLFEPDLSAEPPQARVPAAQPEAKPARSRRTRGGSMATCPGTAPGSTASGPRAVWP